MGTTIPANRASFTIEEVLAATGGTLVQRGAATVVGISTDTRRLQRGNAFVALRGESFDGHEHVAAACKAGAALVVASRAVEAGDGTAVVQVSDTLEALGALARAHKRRWVKEAKAGGRDAAVVAVTGSAGKTTTCRAIRSVLEQVAPSAVHSGAGNLNNAVGVPMVLLGLEPSHRFAVIEIGTSSPGEIAYGVSMTEPDVSVLTLVSCAHAQGLGSIEGVAREKGAIYGLLGRDGTAVVNGDDKLAREQWSRADAGNKIAYGRFADADVRIVVQELEGAETQRLGYEVRRAGNRVLVQARVPLLGDAGAYACGAALAVQLALFGDQFDRAAATRGLEAIQGEERRLRPRELRSGVLLIDDAYNANPASMADSVRTAAAMARQLKRRLVLVLGEMRELGRYAAEEHAALGRIAYESGAAKLIAVAGAAADTAKSAASLGLASEFVDNSRLAAALACTAIGRGDIALVKGSRGVALERVVEALEAQGGGAS